MRDSLPIFYDEEFSSTLLRSKNLPEVWKKAEFRLYVYRTNMQGKPEVLTISNQNTSDAISRDVPTLHWTDLSVELVDTIDAYMQRTFGLKIEKVYATMFEELLSTTSLMPSQSLTMPFVVTVTDAINATISHEHAKTTSAEWLTTDYIGTPDAQSSDKLKVALLRPESERTGGVVWQVCEAMRNLRAERLTLEDAEAWDNENVAGVRLRSQVSGEKIR